MPRDPAGHLEAGPYRVVAASAAELFAFEAQRAAGPFPGGRAWRASWTCCAPAVPADTLVLALWRRAASMVLQGREMHDLPGSVASLIRAGNMQATRPWPTTCCAGSSRRPGSWTDTPSGPCS